MEPAGEPHALADARAQFARERTFHVRLLMPSGLRLDGAGEEGVPRCATALRRVAAASLVVPGSGVSSRGPETAFTAPGGSLGSGGSRYSSPSAPLRKDSRRWS